MKEPNVHGLLCDHISHAHDHGFGCMKTYWRSIIIGDGLFGEHDVRVEINQKFCKYAFLSRALQGHVTLSYRLRMLQGIY